MRKTRGAAERRREKRRRARFFFKSARLKLPASQQHTSSIDSHTALSLSTSTSTTTTGQHAHTAATLLPRRPRRTQNFGPPTVVYNNVESQTAVHAAAVDVCARSRQQSYRVRASSSLSLCRERERADAAGAHTHTHHRRGVMRARLSVSTAGPLFTDARAAGRAGDVLDSSDGSVLSVHFYCELERASATVTDRGPSRCAPAAHAHTQTYSVWQGVCRCSARCVGSCSRFKRESASGEERERERQSVASPGWRKRRRE